MDKICQRIADEIRVHPTQVRAAVELLDGGATVPFIARYRKEATQGLDDIQLRHLEVRLAYLRELEDRRDTVLASIREQGKLSPDLLQDLMAADTKQALEDLYLPYKPKRRTKGQLAREAGLEPLADALLADPTQVPAQAALAFVQAEKPQEGGDFTTVEAVLDGVRDLLAERWAEEAGLVQHLRAWLWQEGRLCCRLIEGKDPGAPEAAKFADYFDYEEPLAQLPSHRALAVFRGRSQGWLDVRLSPPDSPEGAASTLAEGRIAQHLGWRHQQRPADELLRKCVAWTWRVKLSLSLERDLFGRLREEAEQVAIQVFARNLRNVLLAAPAGPQVVMGLDPGLRTGVKVAVIDSTGKLLETATVFPHEPRRDWEGSLHTLARLCRQHGVSLIAIGNGTASRETDQLGADLLRQLAAGTPALVVRKVVVSEAGASVYSASEFASQEMPDVDVSLRGAASIARRLQDPLAELVKIDPKSIGVGQYQHDVNQSELARSLTAVVEDCVNGVGVDLNTASVPLLSRVSGLSPGVARAVVSWRDRHGAFRNRQQLLQVSGLGPKTFEQCAGFLRIRQGDNPLDMTGVHPETYAVVQDILLALGRPVQDVMGRPELLGSLPPEHFAREGMGVITVRDILKELEKPGRDPRPDFQVARFNEGVKDIRDLRAGMLLEGTVSNVAAFGAFVDLGVHQDGLVHLSQLSHRYVQEAGDVVKTGDVVKVRVLEVDVERKRISLSLKLDSPADPRAASGARGLRGHPGQSPGAKSRLPAGGRDGATPAQAASPRTAPPSTAMASAFARLKR